MKRMKKIMAVITILAFVFGGFVSVASASPGQAGVPTGGKVNDGRTGDHRYFNTPTQISANWSDFEVSGEGYEITGYEYRIRKAGSGNIISWRTTSAVLFTEDLAIGVLEEGEKYITDVKAINSFGSSVLVSSLGQTLDLTPPTMNYFALQQNKPYGGGINLQFSANDLNGIENYKIYRNGLLYDTVSGATNTYADVISGDNLGFTYYVKAVDVAGNVSEPSNLQSAIVDDVAPGAPSISYWIGGKNIVVFWPAVSGASSYEIYRNGVLIYSGPNIKYTDTKTVRGTTYNYTVYALDSVANMSLASNTLSIYIPKPKVSSVATTGEVQGTSTGTPEKTEQVSPSPAPSPSGQVEGTESPKPEETQEEGKTNWSLIIAIIIAAAIVISGVLYWWYAREEEEDEI